MTKCHLKIRRHMQAQLYTAFMGPDIKIPCTNMTSIRGGFDIEHLEFEGPDALHSFRSTLRQNL